MEIIFNTDSYETLLAEAQTHGFVNDDQIIINGPLGDAGSYFLNYVGIVYQPTGNTVIDDQGNDTLEMQELPGVWGRLRLNGPADNLPTFSNNITQYVYSEKLDGWSSDNTSKAPDYVSLIGIIA